MGYSDENEEAKISLLAIILMQKWQCNANMNKMYVICELYHSPVDSAKVRGILYLNLERGVRRSIASEVLEKCDKRPEKQPPVTTPASGRNKSNRGEWRI